jgi:two-component system phosphate regulon sensor histidine kinase PhoR
MKGTGLGLAIVKHILTRHQGRLDVKSVVGEGSRFTVELPYPPGASAERQETT